MANQPYRPGPAEKKSSLTPFIIILALLIVTAGGIYLISQSGKQDDGGAPENTGQTNSGAAANQPTEPDPLPNYASAPPGAIPPHYKGSENALVVVEEFADFQCPTCALVHPRMNEITSRFGSKIKFVFRVYPLTTIHRNSYDAAVAAEAAGMQNRFWEMQNLLFRNQRNWAESPQPRPMFEEYAKTLGMDVDKFKEDMAGLVAKRRVDLDMARARALNLTGTPTILVNGRPVSALTTESIAQLINLELARVSKPAESDNSTNSTPDNTNGSNASNK